MRQVRSTWLWRRYGVACVHYLYLNSIIARFLAVLLIPCGTICPFRIRRRLSPRLRGIFSLRFNYDLTRQDHCIYHIRHTHPICITWVQSSLAHFFRLRMGFRCILTGMWQTAFRNSEAHSAIRQTGCHILCGQRFLL